MFLCTSAWSFRIGVTRLGYGYGSGMGWDGVGLGFIESSLDYYLLTWMVKVLKRHLNKYTVVGRVINIPFNNRLGRRVIKR